MVVTCTHVAFCTQKSGLLGIQLFSVEEGSDYTCADRRDLLRYLKKQSSSSILGLCHRLLPTARDTAIVLSGAHCFYSCTYLANGPFGGGIRGLCILGWTSRRRPIATAPLWSLAVLVYAPSEGCPCHLLTSLTNEAMLCFQSNTFQRNPEIFIPVLLSGLWIRWPTETTQLCTSVPGSRGRSYRYTQCLSGS
jgi:hypothetical protein